jgi:uncharacterized protein YegP (UPF0339 family)
MNKTKYRVFWKNWKGEWISHNRTYSTKKSAQRFANSIKRLAENGVYTIQEV